MKHIKVTIPLVYLGCPCCGYGLEKYPKKRKHRSDTLWCETCERSVPALSALFPPEYDKINKWCKKHPNGYEDPSAKFWEALRKAAKEAANYISTIDDDNWHQIDLSDKTFIPSSDIKKP